MKTFPPAWLGYAVAPQQYRKEAVFAVRVCHVCPSAGEARQMALSTGFPVINTICINCYQERLTALKL